MPGKTPSAKKTKTTEVSIVVPAVIEPAQVAIRRQDVSIEAVIQNAIDKGIPVETMERLLSMRRELKAEASKQAFTEAMAAFQAECPIIVKDKIVYEKNSTKIRYKYAPMDSIINQVREVIAKHGLSYTIDIKNEEGLLTAICTITHIAGHSETSSFQVPIDKGGFMSAPQQYAAASTFAKRYALTNALGILTGDEDTDATPDTVAPARPVYQGGVIDQSYEPFPSKPVPKPYDVIADRKKKAAGLLIKLGYDTKHMSKEEAEAAVLKHTKLMMSDANLAEIVNRLAVVASEVQESGVLAEAFIEFPENEVDQDNP